MIFVSDPSIGKFSNWDPPLKPGLSQEDLQDEARVLLVDTVMRTGYTAEDATDKLINRRLLPKYLLILADYEKTENENRASVKEILNRGVEIKRIFYFRPKEGKNIDASWLVPALR